MLSEAAVLQRALCFPSRDKPLEQGAPGHDHGLTWADLCTFPAAVSQEQIFPVMSHARQSWSRPWVRMPPSVRISTCTVPDELPSSQHGNVEANSLPSDCERLALRGAGMLPVGSSSPAGQAVWGTGTAGLSLVPPQTAPPLLLAWFLQIPGGRRIQSRADPLQQSRGGTVGTWGQFQAVVELREACPCPCRAPRTLDRGAGRGAEAQTALSLGVLR